MRPDFTISTIREAMDTDTKPSSFRAALEEIQNGRWAMAVEDVRQAYQRGVLSANGHGDAEKAGKDAAGPAKKKLPGYLFSGTFTRRAKEALIEQSGLICVDLDNLGDRVEATRDLIVQDPHTLAAFISPSGTGLKVIFRCDPTKDHYLSFRAAGEYVLRHFGLEIDEACKDVNRICFTSYDPDLFAADDAEVLPYPEPVKEFHVPLDKPRLGLPETTPGDDYDSRGDIGALLRSYGWSQVGKNGWRRPDKTEGVSATFDKVPGRFYVFSSSTQFQANHVYKPWHVYAILECAGDFREAARRLGRNGYGAQQSLQSEPIQNDMPVAEEDWGSEPAPAVAPTGLIAKPLTDFSLPARNDSSVLIGNRYISRGDIVIIASTSGMGKSSLSLQMAAHWALGLPIFGGFQPNGPLKSLIFQSEDSDGDVAEVWHSILHAMKLTPDQVTQVRSRVLIVTDRIHRGLSFRAEAKRQIELHSPDFVWVNPLLAFIGGDVNDSTDVGRFLREEMNSLNEPPKFAFNFIHHTAKPPKDRKDRQWNEVMYEMAGSADLTNAARAILSLQACEKQGHFKLVLAKRGARAGIKKLVPGTINPEIKIEQPALEVGLRHSGERMEVDGQNLPVIFWEEAPIEADKPKHAGGRPSKYNIEQLLHCFPKPGEDYLSIPQIYRKVRLVSGISESGFKDLVSRAHSDGLLIRQERSTGYVFNVA